jgi:hypothetical protein
MKSIDDASRRPERLDRLQRAVAPARVSRLPVGGVGMRRGRPDTRPLRVGDAVDFWRVEAYEPPTRLRLLAEMKLPGRAWLEFAVEPDGPGSRVTQTAIFDPVGLLGRAYWYGVYPLHELVFIGMLEGIAKRAKL